VIAALYPFRAIRAGRARAERGRIAERCRTLAPPPIVSFALSRALVCAASVAAFLALGPSRAATASHDAGLSDVGWPVDIWANWDGTWYADIARHGYARASSTAFFPLYPYLTRAVGWALGGHVVLASVLISLTACLLAFVVLHRLTSGIAGPSVANHAVLYLAIFPTALFLQASYAESLFLVLALTTFLLAERGHLVWAGAACGLAMLTRPTGIALLVALVVFARRRSEWKRGATAVVVAVALFAVYPLMLWFVKGDPLAFAAAQHHWGRQFSPIGPLFAVCDSVFMTVVYAIRLVAGGPHTPDAAAFDFAAFNNLFALLSLVFFTALLVAVHRRFGVRSPYFVYSFVSLAIPLFSPIPGNPLLSLPRLGLMIFPFFMALAMSTRTQRVAHTSYVVASATLLAIASATFAVYGWVG
jgi:Mannosyltransferase (PIG-V)